eukprot:PITA_35130
MAKDRLSALDDSLLCSHILSKLPLRDAVRTSILSRRWRSLWTSLPYLTFLDADFNEKVIDNIMCFHHGDLESLEISVNNWYWSPNDRLTWKLVRAASVKKVKQITLKDVVYSMTARVSLHVPTSMFSCHYLTFLEVMHFEFKLPSYFSGFRYLKTCILSYVHIIDDMLEQLASKCPLLEDLRIVSCPVGLNNLEISAQSLKYFYFCGNRYENALTVTMNCSKLVNVTIHNCPSMLSLELNSCEDLHFSTTELHVLECLSNRNSLRKITLSRLSTHVPSLTVLGSFSNLEELSIKSNSFEARSPVTGSLTLPLMANLKKVLIRVSGFDEEEIALIGCLLRNAPSLQTMTLTLPICSEYVHEQSFLKQLLALSRSSGQATVLITTNQRDNCKRCLASSEDEDFANDESPTSSDDESPTSSDDE